MTMPNRLFLLAALAFLTACSSVPPRIAALSEYVAATPNTTMKVPYPILLLHGLGQKSDVWHGSASRYFSDELGLTFGGVIRVTHPTVRITVPTTMYHGPADYYQVSFTNPLDSINGWRNELAPAIDAVLQATGADRVILIGYSMGGLAARAYLTQRLNNHHVKRLITVGTPHLGSPFAKVWTWKTMLNDCSQKSNPLISIPCDVALRAFKGTEGDVPYDSPAIRDLRRPEDGGTFVRALGKYSHPLDVEYVSVIGELNMFTEARKLSEGWLQELLRKAMAVTGGGLPELFEPGDGVVSARSQDIMNIEFFSVDPARRRAARTVHVKSVHEEHLQSSVEIQRTALDEKPEFKGAEIARQGDTALLIVDFTDHIPEHCSARIDVRTSSDDTVTLIAPARSSILIQTTDGIVSRFVVPLHTVPKTSLVTTQFRIYISNTFGHTVTATKDW